ncbi:hypothetical protein HYPSUDRAFT_208166 [Hypholoma sublateritium FD-334 SS-4]|uniref:Uncharacterized protein n=1 Tax=Hypholoma sublateritium (strain FD-334 SS-4) TaxID=945553 RepID=A0A0D2P3J6_HYPSF|nr:hypothetical protein HYPSUDRAFT_208166 [Hypholoma sublateritium FD-334 SS-4]
MGHYAGAIQHCIASHSAIAWPPPESLSTSPAAPLRRNLAADRRRGDNPDRTSPRAPPRPPTPTVVSVAPSSSDGDAGALYHHHICRQPPPSVAIHRPPSPTNVLVPPLASRLSTLCAGRSLGDSPCAGYVAPQRSMTIYVHFGGLHCHHTSFGPTAGTRTSLTASHAVAVAEGAVPPPTDGLLQPAEYWCRLGARPLLTDSATLTLCATAHPSPTAALRHYLSPDCLGDKASRITILAVAMVAIESCRHTPPPMAPAQTIHRQSSLCSSRSEAAEHSPATEHEPNPEAEARHEELREVQWANCL